MKFKVGDIVRIVKGTNAGTVATIEYIRDYPYHKYGIGDFVYQEKCLVKEER